MKNFSCHSWLHKIVVLSQSLRPIPTQHVSSWWFQPIWKILYSQIASFPQGSGWKRHILEIHHPGVSTQGTQARSLEACKVLMALARARAALVKVKALDELEGKSVGKTLKRVSCPYHPCMVYLPTWMVDFHGFHVGKYAIHGCYE